MIATLNELVKSIQGSLGSNTYARRMAESGKIIIQRKPNRKLKRGQKRDPKLVATNQVMARAQARVKTEYHDPEKRAVWEARYQELEKACQKKGSRSVDGGKENAANGGYDLPYRLYDWMKKMIMREEYAKETSGESATSPDPMPM